MYEDELENSGNLDAEFVNLVSIPRRAKCSKLGVDLEFVVNVALREHRIG